MLNSGIMDRVSGNDENIGKIFDISRAGGASASSVDSVPSFKFFFAPPPSLDCCFVPKDIPVPSYMEATDPFADDHEDAINAARKVARKLKQENKSPLDLDKTAAICLYTLHDNGIYSSLNKALCHAAADDIPAAATILQPWTKYIRLLTEALNALPNYSDDVTLYRGVKQDLQASFKSVVGQVICWAAFASCTTSMEQLAAQSNPMFQGKRTIFVIRCRRGKDIKLFNTFGQEVLLMATTKFKVTRVDHGGDDDADLTMVHLDEVDTTEGYPLLNIFGTRVIAAASSSCDDVLCDKHNEKIKFLCHDCGDKLACIDCISTLPCSKHQKRILLDDAIVKYRDEAQSNMAVVNNSLQQDLEKMKQRFDLAIADKHRCLDKTKAIFDKYIEMLIEMKQSHLQMIEQAADDRCALLDSRCKEIGKMIAEWDNSTNEVHALIAQSDDDASANNVDKLNAALQAKKNSIEMKFAAAESFEQLYEWMRDEGDDKYHFVHNYGSVGKEVELMIMKLKLETRKPLVVDKRPISIDLKILDGVNQGKIDAIQLIQMEDPAELCRVSSDVIAVAEHNAGRISLVSLSTRSIIRSFGQGFLKNPYGICMNHEGHFVVSDLYKNQMFLFDKDDGHLMKASNPAKLKLKYPCGISYDERNHRIIVADCYNHRVLILNKDLDTVIETIGGTKGSNEGQFGLPTGVGIDSKGRIVVSENSNHRIQIFEEQDDSSATRGKSHQFASTFGKQGNGHGQFNRCYQLSLDRNDRIIICDNNNKRVQVFDCAGRFIGCTPDLKSHCQGVCLDGKGRIVCSVENNSIYTFAISD